VPAFLRRNPAPFTPLDPQISARPHNRRVRPRPREFRTAAADRRRAGCGSSGTIPSSAGVERPCRQPEPSGPPLRNRRRPSLASGRLARLCEPVARTTGATSCTFAPASARVEPCNTIPFRRKR
jgi:hypothetical protein